MSTSILIIGTLDSKGTEFAFLRDLITARGHNTLMMDVGVMAEPAFSPDISASQVAEAANESLSALRATADRGEALAVMAQGASTITTRLYAEGKVAGVISLGGSGGTAIATHAMQALPVGLPKVMVSTMAAGDVGAYVGVKDITMMYSVVDVAGLNRISRRIIANAAGAICGMVEQAAPPTADKPLITATMFGVTTPCVTMVREKLEAEGYEVLVFHATGSGGRAMEALIESGFVTAVADITTTEWCDELVGGILSAGPHRLEAAAKAGIPQVVSVGALDMVNFGSLDTVPEQFRKRTLYKHNPTVTLMRTTPEECAELGEIIANKLNQSTGPTALLIPRKGVSMIDAEGQPFHAPEADEALFQALREHIDPSHVELIELDLHINDPQFAEAIAARLLHMLADF
ncbi:MAG: UPF0261 family protein [Chloroflexi bacterium]|nr:UPF0261 family protein [Chloroflexota bacterium]